jgi:hypothetical protein
MADSAIIQCWNGNASALVQNVANMLYPAPPRVGIVVGTYAAVPYVHLQLEARRRFYPQVPLLIHDDASARTADLRALCEEYGCDFEHNAARQPPCLGDLTAFVGGLWWAQHKELDILLKVSRRWVFLVDWQPSLNSLALQSQYATFCSYTTTFRFGFRTECVGLAVRSWGTADFFDDAIQQIRSQNSVFVEGYMHGFARRFEARNCPQAEVWRQAHPMAADKNGYAIWMLMGTDRCMHSDEFLWHDFASPRDYFQVAKSWGLPYTEHDFSDPNQGEGNGT